MTRLRFYAALLLALGVLIRPARAAEPTGGERHLLYVAAPGIRDDLQYGGAGILVFDIDHGHRFVRRIDTPASRGAHPENMKGICACARTGRLYFTTLHRLYCLDLHTDRALWDRALPGGCDRLAMTPDGSTLYVPSLEGPHWNVVDGKTGALRGKVQTGSGAHNTICSLDGTEVYLAGLRSPLLRVLETRTGKVARTVGPFSAPIRPFTVNGEKSRCYVNVNGLLGFEIGDLKSGKMLARVQVKGVPTGPTKRHGCPSHGIGLTPDEKEAWVCDGHNSMMHVFDLAGQSPRQTASIPLREQPGWITFSLDGHYAYPSTGDVIDTRTKRIVTGLQDEKGRPVESEKMVEVVFRGAEPVRAGDQFGLGRGGESGK